jgi:sugar-specific transcriptional regulator TrmB
MEQMLEKLGLDIYEARVYLALLELGPSLVTKISQKADINRTTSYDILQRLLKYGLIRKASGEGAKQKYSAEPPEKLVKFLDKRKSLYEDRIEEAKVLLPQLKLLYKTKARPVIKFFEGVEGVKEIYEETLKSKEEILSCINIDGWDVDEFRDWGKSYNKKRTQLKIPERILALKTPKGVKWLENYPTTLKYTSYRWLPKEKFPFFFAEINIYEDKLVIALLKKPNYMGIMIQSQELVNVLKALYELAWERAGEINQK